MKKFYIAERLTLLSAIARSMDDSKRGCGLCYMSGNPNGTLRSSICNEARIMFCCMAAPACPRSTMQKTALYGAWPGRSPLERKTILKLSSERKA